MTNFDDAEPMAAPDPDRYPNIILSRLKLPGIRFLVLSVPNADTLNAQAFLKTLGDDLANATEEDAPSPLCILREGWELAYLDPEEEPPA